MNWPNDFDGAHQVGGVNEQSEKKYIYESPDKGKTVYRREFGKLDRELVSQPKQG
jgi:hypothetical protein